MRDKTNKERAVAILNSLQSKDQTVALEYVSGEKYIQHNLGAPDGREGFLSLFEIPGVQFKVSVVRALEDGDYVATHTEYDFFGPKIGFDVFRFENGKAVEHWDNLQPMTGKNPSGHTMTDGPTDVEDRDKTEANKMLVRNFIGDILASGKMDRLAGYFDGDNYIQHNPQIADGLSGLGEALEALGKQGITMKYDKTHLVVGEGNFVLAVSEGTFGDKPTCFYDLWRVEDGKIAEHWDVIETIPARSEWKNSNGKF